MSILDILKRLSRNQKELLGMLVGAILFLSIFDSCMEPTPVKPVEYYYKNRVLTGKAIEGEYEEPMLRRYLLGFSDGATGSVSFGKWSCFNEGDTVLFRYIKGTNEWTIIIDN